MSKILPAELVILIVSEVSLSKERVKSLASLSLVCKSFASLCQSHLWSDITLYSNGQPSTHLYSRTATFCKRIAANPHLGRYVRRLSYGLSSLVDPCTTATMLEFEAIAKALRCMPDVEEFKLTYGGTNCITAMGFDAYPSAWQNAILGLVKGCRLRELTLRRISALPLSAFHDVSENLEAIKLAMCSFGSPSPGGGTQRGPAHSACPPRSSRLRYIACDADSYSGLNLLSRFGMQHTLSRSPFSELKMLDISFTNELDESHSMLHAAAKLEILNFTIQGLPSRPLRMILSNLNPGSYVTLTHLRVTFQNIPSALTPSTVITEACISLLSKFTALQTFELDMHLLVPRRPVSSNVLQTHSIDTLPWAQLDHTPCTYLTELRKVRVRMYLKFASGGPGDWMMRNRLDAEFIEDVVLWEGVFERQMGGLRTNKEQGGIDFKFSVSVRQPESVLR
ncbi:hypothetical protein NMY22_g1736 [Coprinellus aureogranulatus]|nr:hypothetical protein NMY22_g1736 [Coprinellus aureogranulatus]